MRKVGFEVYDKDTQLPVSRPLASKTTAHRRCDKLNNAYGRYRYIVRYVNNEN